MHLKTICIRLSLNLACSLIFPEQKQTIYLGKLYSWHAVQYNQILCFACCVILEPFGEGHKKNTQRQFQGKCVNKRTKSCMETEAKKIEMNRKEKAGGENGGRGLGQVA